MSILAERCDPSGPKVWEQPVKRKGALKPGALVDPRTSLQDFPLSAFLSIIR